MTESRPPLRARDPLTPPLAVRLPEAARLLSISTRSLRRLIASGDLVASRAGRVILVQVKEIEAFLARNRIGGAP